MTFSHQFKIGHGGHSGHGHRTYFQNLDQKCWFQERVAPSSKKSVELTQSTHSGNNEWSVVTVGTRDFKYYCDRDDRRIPLADAIFNRAIYIRNIKPLYTNINMYKL